MFRITCARPRIVHPGSLRKIFAKIKKMAESPLTQAWNQQLRWSAHCSVQISETWSWSYREGFVDMGSSILVMFITGILFFLQDYNEKVYLTHLRRILAFQITVIFFNVDPTTDTPSEFLYFFTTLSHARHATSLQGRFRILQYLNFTGPLCTDYVVNMNFIPSCSCATILSTLGESLQSVSAT